MASTTSRVQDVASLDHLKVTLKAKDALVVFYSPHCPHCVNMMPALHQLALERPDITVVKYNMLTLGQALRTENEDVGALELKDQTTGAPMFAIRGFPTIMLTPKGLVSAPVEYRGSRTAGAMAQAFDGYKVALASDTSLPQLSGGGGGGRRRRKGPLHGLMRRLKQTALGGGATREDARGFNFPLSQYRDMTLTGGGGSGEDPEDETDFVAQQAADDRASEEMKDMLQNTGNDLFKPTGKKIEDLKTEVQKLTQELERVKAAKQAVDTTQLKQELEYAKQKCEAQIQGLRAQNSKLKETKQTLMQQKNKCDNDLIAEQTSLDESKTQVAQLKKSLDELQAQHTATTQDLTEKNRNEEKLKQNLEKAKQDVQAQAARVQELKSEKKTLREQLDQVTIEKANIEGNEQTCKDLREKLDETTEKLKRCNAKDINLKLIVSANTQNMKVLLVILRPRSKAPWIHQTVTNPSKPLSKRSLTLIKPGSKSVTVQFSNHSNRHYLTYFQNQNGLDIWVHLILKLASQLQTIM